jgi:hypothetical protein
MTKRRTQRRDPMDSVIESALQPGRFIRWNEGVSFVSNLRHMESEIVNIVTTDPARAATLYETFIAGCNLKAEEIDDSDGELGTFAGGLFCVWIQARQAAGADRGETAKLLLTWMDHDDYGFCNDLGRDAVKVLDREGLEAFEREAQVRFEAACAAAGKREDRALNYDCDRWGQILRSIFLEQHSIQKYLALTALTDLTQADCEAIATMLGRPAAIQAFETKRKLNEALAWVERGLGLEKPNAFSGGVSHKLGEMRRALLVKLRRGGEALDSAWAEFQAHPSQFTYAELIRYVPKAERRAWHEKAMVASEQGDLASIIELWLGTKEIDRLVARLDYASNTQLESLSHYVTEPAAERLAKTHPGMAAKVFRALCMRIIDAGKSKYYDAALANLEKAKSCYRNAGLDAQWQALAAEIRREHFRKSGFMPGFERIVRGARPEKESSFLDRARGRWTSRAKA